MSAKPSKKSVRRIKEKIRQAPRSGNHDLRAEAVAQINRLVREWANYFSHGSRTRAYRAIDHDVYEAMRHFLRRRHKVRTRGTRRFSEPRIFGEIGVLRLRTLFGVRSACAVT